MATPDFQLNIICVAFLLVSLLLAQLQCDQWRWLASLVTACLWLRENFFAALFVNGMVFLVAKGLVGQTKHRWRLSCQVMIFLAGTFFIGKYFDLKQTRVQLFEDVSIPAFHFSMWQFLALMTFVWEIGSDRIKIPRFQDFLWWAFMPLTLSGPLIRFSQLNPLSSTFGKFRFRNAAWWKGLAYSLLGVAAGYGLRQVFIDFSQGSDHRVWNGIHIFLASPWVFLLTVGGEYEFRRRLGMPCGIHIGPSFNKPFFQKNIGDFWANWNMTVTSVFREYFFFNRWGLATYNVYFNVLFLFLFMGLWHATNLYWLIFGLIHGLGFCAFLAFRPYRKCFPKNRWTDLLGGVATYIFVCFAWYLPSKLIEFFS